MAYLYYKFNIFPNGQTTARTVSMGNVINDPNYQYIDYTFAHWCDSSFTHLDDYWWTRTRFATNKASPLNQVAKTQYDDGIVAVANVGAADTEHRTCYYTINKTSRIGDTGDLVHKIGITFNVNGVEYTYTDPSTTFVDFDITEIGLYTSPYVENVSPTVRIVTQDGEGNCFIGSVIDTAVVNALLKDPETGEEYDPENPNAPVKNKPANNIIQATDGKFHIGLNYPTPQNTKNFKDDLGSVPSLSDPQTYYEYLVYRPHTLSTSQPVYDGEGGAGAYVSSGWESDFKSYLNNAATSIHTATNFVGLLNSDDGYYDFKIDQSGVTFESNFFPFSFTYDGTTVTCSLSGSDDAIVFSSGSNTFSIPFDTNNIYRIFSTAYNRYIGYSGFYIVKTSRGYEVWATITYGTSHTASGVTYDTGVYSLAVLPQWLEDFFDDSGISEGGDTENPDSETMIYDDLVDADMTGEVDDEDYNPHDGTPGNGTGDPFGEDETIDDPYDDIDDDMQSSTGMFRVFTPSLQQLNDFSAELNSSSVLNVLKDYFTTNPMDGIIGLQIIPFGGFSSSTTKKPVIGTHTFDTSMTIASKDIINVNYGSLSINHLYDDSWMDYEPYTSIQIFLPYIGFKEIDTNAVMGTTVSLKYNVNVLTGDILAYLYSRHGDGQNHLLYQWQGNCSMQIPVAHTDYSRIVSASIGAIAGIATAVGGGVSGSAGTVISGVSTAVQSATQGVKAGIRTSGALSGSSAFMGSRTPYLLYSKPIYVAQGENDKPTSYYQHEYGKPLGVTHTVSELSGYTVIKNLDVSGISATEQERDEIKRLFSEGVYV